jgi:HK97 family phage major capsid protein
MEIDEKKLAEITAEAATKAVEEYKAKDVTRKLDTKVVVDEVDKITSDKKGGFKNFGHFLHELRVIEDKTYTPPDTLVKWASACRQKTAGTMEETDLSQGGYNVPTEFGEHIYAESLESSIVRPRARFQPMRSNRIEIAADVDATHSGTFFGGVTIYRTNEGGQFSASNPTYEKIGLTLHKITGLVHVTDELMDDSNIAIEADVSRKFSQAIAFVMDDDFLNGSGANMPLGALNSANPSIITVTAVSGQGASTVIAENIRDMWARMYPVGQSRAIWLANNDVFPQLFGLSLAIGNAGVPIWLPAGGVSGAPYSTLMGRPLILTEKCQTLGTAGDIALVDLSAYIVAGKANGEAPAIASSMHFKFDYGMQSFRFAIRYDGQPLWRSTLTPKYSANTLSPFVVLNGTRT